MAVPLILIVAYSRNRVIGRDNALPWKLPGDLAHFKRSTVGHPIVMGRKTWESLGRPLPGRLNVVITRDGGYTAQGAVVVHGLDEAIAACGDASRAFIIGGEQIYRTALPQAHEILATEVDAEVEGDAFFPPLPAAHWEESDRQRQAAENGYTYDFVTYRRRVQE